MTTDFEIGLDGLPFSTDDDINGTLTWTLNLDFGVDDIGGTKAFYLDSTGREVDVDFLFNPGSDFHVDGNFGLLDVGLSESATSTPATETRLTGEVVVDLATNLKLRAPSAATITSATTVDLEGHIDMTAVMGVGLTFNSGSNIYESNSPFPTFNSHFTVTNWEVGARRRARR